MERGSAADPMITAVRVFTTRAEPITENERPRRAGRKRPRRRYMREALIWDTETVTTPDQRLVLLVWRLYLTESGTPPTLSEEGIAYPDELFLDDPAVYELLVRYSESHRSSVPAALTRPGSDGGLLYRPLSWWLEKRLFRYGYGHRDRCDVVGFNLPFDFGRVARYWSDAEGDFRGGWSLGIWGDFDANGRWHDRRYRPRLRMRPIDPRRTLFSWGATGESDDAWRGSGRFVDLRTLAFALTDKSLSLEGACDAFGVPYAKNPVVHGQVTPELVSYARQDVAATASLYFACLEELALHEGIDLPAHRLYSPATIGARYLDAMGYRRPLEKFTTLTPGELGWRTRGENAPDQVTEAGLNPRLLGWAMSAFFGGRAEARIVRTPVPVAYVDFTSMYPTVNALLNTRALLNADHLTEMDATSAVQDLLGRDDLQLACLQPETWSDEIGVTLVELQPHGDILPVRGRYDPHSGDYGIGVNPCHLDGTAWYALPDAIAASILTGRPPDVIRAIRLCPVGEQKGLRSARLRGGEPLDPRSEDPFVSMIQERHRVRNDSALSEVERERLQRFLKITANATAYGVLARFDRREQARATRVNVLGPDDEPRQADTSAPEDPGPYCFPPIAASITAAARLMLALLEHAVTSAGGSYAFCDTDSMAIVATPAGDSIDCATDSETRITALSWDAVSQILTQFNSLNPYDPELVPNLWKPEHHSLTEPLWCYAISAKRYALFHRGPDGQPTFLTVRDRPETSDDSDAPAAEDDDLVDRSEHGLGIYLDPIPGDSTPTGRGKPSAWVTEAWHWILRDALTDERPPLPSWAIAYAVTRFTVSGQHTAEWFRRYNAHRPRERWIRPGSFGLIAHPAPLFGTDRRPTAPYSRDPEEWPGLSWYDRTTGKPLRLIGIGVEAPSVPPPGPQESDTVLVQELGTVLAQYRLRPEYKSLSPNGDPATKTSAGKLLRRPVASSRPLTDLTGKEGNKLLERLSGEIEVVTDYRADYGSLSERWPIVLEAIRQLGIATIARRSGMHRRTIERFSAYVTPHRTTVARVLQAVAEESTSRLGAAGSTEPFADIARFLAQGPRLCACGCGRPLPPGRRKWFQEACRQRSRKVG